MQGNQNRLCGPLMRSNCCCDSHSTTRQVSCKKGSISSAARTRVCKLPLLLLWEACSSEVECKRSRGGVMASSFWKVCRFAVHMKTGGLRFFGFLKKVRFQALRFQDLCGRSAKTMQYMCVFAKERSHLDGPSGPLLHSVPLHYSGEKSAE